MRRLYNSIEEDWRYALRVYLGFNYSGRLGEHSGILAADKLLKYKTALELTPDY